MFCLASGGWKKMTFVQHLLEVRGSHEFSCANGSKSAEDLTKSWRDLKRDKSLSRLRHRIRNSLRTYKWLPTCFKINLDQTTSSLQTFISVRFKVFDLIKSKVSKAAPQRKQPSKISKNSYPGGRVQWNVDLMASSSGVVATQLWRFGATTSNAWWETSTLS